MTTLEQVIETARRLPAEDRRRLQQWLTEEERRDAQPPSAVTSQHQMERFCVEQFQREVAEYRSAKQWIAAHRAEYLGQWVALEGDRLISHGPNALQVDAAARAAGIAVPFVVRIVEEPKFYYSGW